MRFSAYYGQLLLMASCIALLLSGCKDDKHTDPEKAAVYYVNCVVKGEYDKYIKGMLSCDEASDEYIQNMRNLLVQMVDEKKEAGLTDVKDVMCERIEGNIDDKEVMVYMKLTYQNDSTENVLIPLLWVDGQWRLR